MDVLALLGHPEEDFCPAHGLQDHDAQDVALDGYEDLVEKAE